MQVFIDGAYSHNFIMQYGLPQGSVMGPLGFIFYTHAVGYILRHHGIKYHLYADDIQMYIIVDPSILGDVACALFRLFQCVKDKQNWMATNKLKLNQDKT